jgi:hypothetical protein
MITVVNIKHHGKPQEPWEVYVGRWNKGYGLAASPLASPFRVDKHGRTVSITKYAERAHILVAEAETAQSLMGPAVAFKRELIRLNRVLKAYGKLVLICWCAPDACHGDVIKAILYEWNNLCD